MLNCENKILVTEDDDANYTVIECYLKRLGAVVDRATYGNEALDKCLACGYDLVIMDVRMPFKDGIEATGVLKCLYPDLKILIQTAYITSEEAKKCFDAGCDAFLLKPFTYTQLASKVQCLLATQKETSEDIQ